jgi:hypothetical protein
VLLVFPPNQPFNFTNMEVKAYFVPTAGLSGTVSALSNLVVVSGGVRGSLDLITLSLPAVAGYNTQVNDYGCTIDLNARFLEGTLDLFSEMWWLCGFFDCGGSCNKQFTYNVLRGPATRTTRTSPTRPCAAHTRSPTAGTTSS